MNHYASIILKHKGNALPHPAGRKDMAGSTRAVYVKREALCGKPRMYHPKSMREIHKKRMIKRCPENSNAQLSPTAYENSQLRKGCMLTSKRR